VFNATLMPIIGITPFIFTNGTLLILILVVVLILVSILLLVILLLISILVLVVILISLYYTMYRLTPISFHILEKTTNGKGS